MEALSIDALPGPATGGGDSDTLVVADFLKELSASMELPVAVAAIRALVAVIQRSGANTMMGLEKELLVASGELQRFQSTSIALRAACELFMCYVTRTSALDSQNDSITLTGDDAKAHQLAFNTVGWEGGNLLTNTLGVWLGDQTVGSAHGSELPVGATATVLGASVSAGRDVVVARRK